MQLRALTGLFALLLPGAATGTTPAEIEACVLRNQPEISSVMSVSLHASDLEGELGASRGTVYWRRFDDGGSRLLLRMTEPEDLRGTSFLLIETEGGEPELYVFLPGRAQVRKITGRRLEGSLFGTDFRYADLARLQQSARELRFELLEEGQRDGRPVWILVDRPAPEAREGRVVTVLDRETCLPLRTEFIGARHEVEKVLTLDPDRVQRAGERYVVRELLMRDLERDTQTRLSIDEIELDRPLPAELFTRAALAEGAVSAGE